MAEKLEIRTQIYLDKAQHEALKQKAAEKATSMAQIIREAVAVYLAQTDLDEDFDLQAYLDDPVWKIPEVAQRFEGTGFPNAAENHDVYIYDRERPS
jgi:NAD-dependent DNA ligase